MHPIGGLVLHDCSFQGRKIFYRAGLSDMVVPYGDRDWTHSRKHVMDASEFGFSGVGSTNSLKLGCDCLGEIRGELRHSRPYETPACVTSCLPFEAAGTRLGFFL